MIGLVVVSGDDNGSSSAARRAAALVPAGGATAYQLQLSPGPAEGKEAIELESFSWGATNATTIGSATGGAGAGKVKFNELTISKKVDKASPTIFKTSAMGAHYQTATLTLRKAGEKTPYMTYTMETVFVTNVTYSGDSPNVATETVTFVFGKVTVESVDGAGA